MLTVRLSSQGMGNMPQDSAPESGLVFSTLRANPILFSVIAAAPEMSAVFDPSIVLAMKSVPKYPRSAAERIWSRARWNGS